MTAAEGGGPRIAIWPLADSSAACSLDRHKRGRTPATWRVDVNEIPRPRGQTFGTTSYVCDGCLAGWVRSLMVRWVIVESPPAKTPARKVKGTFSPRRRKVGAR